MAKPGISTAEALIVWVVLYVFFLVGLASNLSAAHDSINYLLHISRGEHLFHPHHLLYHWVARGWLLAWQPVFPSISEHLVVEAFTSAWGSAAMAVSYLFFRRRFMFSSWHALAAIAPIVFSYGVWFYSINVEVYAPPVFFILLALYRMTSPHVTEKDAWLVILLHNAAILFHQSNILFTPLVIYWLYKRWRPGFSVMLSRYILFSIICCGGAYLLAGYSGEGHRDFASLSQWLLGYTAGHDYWQPLDAKTPLKVAAGFSRTFIGAQFLFHVPGLEHVINSSFLKHSLHDELFLTRKLPAAVAVVLLVLSVVFALMFLILVFRFITRWRSLGSTMQAAGLMIATILVYSVFFLFWMPQILDFWILQMVLLWMVLLGTLPVVKFPFGWRSVTVSLVFASLLLLINYAGSIRWLQSFDNDWYHVQVKKLPAKKGDLVIVRDKWILKDYVRYFTDAQVLATDETHITEENIRAEVAITLQAGGRVFINVPEDKNGGWRLIQSY